MLFSKVTALITLSLATALVSARDVPMEILDRKDLKDATLVTKNGPLKLQKRGHDSCIHHYDHFRAENHHRREETEGPPRTKTITTRITLKVISTATHGRTKTVYTTSTPTVSLTSSSTITVTVGGDITVTNAKAKRTLNARANEPLPDFLKDQPPQSISSACSRLIY
ncbi:hypothetical protein K440DRAFT_643536 [Wilcoxina mikolae CBS 423.85]|nr:hypothetical protein K440DRAFT_643536 [Wilcoxina mikolae CBS 423.85]